MYLLGSLIENIPVFFTYGKAAYIVRSSPATPTGYKMIKKLYWFYAMSNEPHHKDSGTDLDPSHKHRSRYNSN